MGAEYRTAYLCREHRAAKLMFPQSIRLGKGSDYSRVLRLLPGTHSAVLLPSMFILLCFPASSAILIFAGHVLCGGVDTTPVASLSREPRATKCSPSLLGLGKGQNISVCFACCQGFCCHNFCRPCSLRWGSGDWGDIVPRPSVENSEPPKVSSVCHTWERVRI